MTQIDMHDVFAPELGSAAAILKGEKRPDFKRDEVLAEIFAATVARDPDRVAMIENGRRLTFREVDRLSAVMAHNLVTRGIGVGDVVGLWLPRGADLLIAQIAITRTGATWLPFDADAPVERIAVCLADAEAKGLVTHDSGRPRAEAAGLTVFTQADLAISDAAIALPVRPPGLTSDHPAYLIYTSGSTGTPKGIVVSHANICHYLRAANAVYGITPEDVVFQGASVAFDLSMEEIWIPYLVGATMVVATPDVMGETDKLARLLADERITVLDTVPTLLAMLTEDVPSLRVIILGGEACPPVIVERWATPGRRLFNSYGPTEATVVATVAEVARDEPVTIGGPIPNYSCYVADPETLTLKPVGAEGELLIGGPGVAKGYLKRAALTAEKFIANPYASDGDDPVLYRSGDAVVVDPDGLIHFRGRIDDQVKIRGFRVELGEIEARIQALPEIGNAAVVLRNDDGLDQLVAFLVPVAHGASAGLDAKALRRGLAQSLPAYMVPSRFETVAALPRLASGKVDRKALKALPLALIETADDQDQPRTATEAALLAAATKVFPGQAVPFDADFFTDMGGHSLLAARFIGHVREDARFASITLQDVYGLRQLRAMAAALDQRGAGVSRDLSFEPVPLLRRFWCGLAQAVTLPVILFLLSAQWLGIFVVFQMLDADELGFAGQVFSLLGVYVAITVITSFIGIAGKWLAIGRMKAGVYPLWGSYYFRWWLASRFTSLIKAKWFQGTPVMAAYMRLMGARIGRDVIISDFDAGSIDLISIGDRVTTGAKTKFANVEIVGNRLIVGTITIGDDAYIGTSSVIGENAVIGEGAEIGDLSAVEPGTHVPAWELWKGSPAAKAGLVDHAALPAQAEATRIQRFSMTALYVIALLTVPPLGLLPIFPAFWAFDNMDQVISGFTKADTLTYLPLLAFPTAILLIVFTMLMLVGMRWIILPRRLTPGVHSVHSSVYFRKWVLGLATEVKLETLSSLFATLYMRTWYHLMGMRIGKGSEISTAINGRYDLVEIGANNFIADEVLLGDEDIRRGWMELKMVSTGDRVFVGNDAVVPPGTVIGDDALLGIKSVPPASQTRDAYAVGPKETWFGSPAIQLPTRQKVDAAANWTYAPSFGRKAARALFEAAHTAIPTMLFITLGYWAVALLETEIDESRWFAVFGVFLLASCIIPVVMTLATAGLKWLMVGRYRPGMQPLWSFWSMRAEATAVLYWGLAGKVFLESLRGTPFLPVILRLYGTRTGKGICMNSTDITEFDCVTIGDHCAINAMSALQTHLYEDRIMKVGRVELGRGVTVGAGATVLYDTKVGDFAQLGCLTVVMKGETIPASSAWTGAPAQPTKVMH
ncbi:MAG: Pls/PosA family non-ribosomal peptide synthetase [Phreatobacter sp.]